MSTAFGSGSGRLDYTTSGYIQDATDVYDSLTYHFVTSPFRNQQLAGRVPINRYHFFLYTFAANPVPRPLEAFNRLEGIRDQYQYCVFCNEVVFMRRRSCWCIHCMADLMKGAVTWARSTHQVTRCQSISNGSMNGSNVYCFDKNVVQRPKVLV